jgi:hypothetical protein
MNRFALLARVGCMALACAACNGSDGDNQGDPPDDNDGDTMESSGDPSNGASGSAAPPDSEGEGEGSETGGAAGDDAIAGPRPMTIPSARGMCDIDSGFPGDEACLAPPDPDKGFQIHIGPDDYTDPAQIAVFAMEPGDESSECYMKKMPLDHDAFYFVYELSGRAGTHHIINTLRADDVPDGFGSCGGGEGSSLGMFGGASKPHMPPMPVAPENENLGLPIKANMQVQHDMHYFNLTQAPILREFWMNVYYVDPEKVEETPLQIAGLGGFGWNRAPIEPGTHQVYAYECPIESDGRIIQLLGHTHAHGIRETAHIRRANGDRLKVFEQYDYLEPQIFMYDSLTENPEFSVRAPGAHTGMIDVAAGDALEWECEINNDSTTPLRYINEVQTGEMCNIWGMSIGPRIACFRQ